jgi:uncharacterized protein
MSDAATLDRPANRLIHQTSPYLLQHARNPVDWHPWDDEALTKARHEDKPILLSIGYSACHWCHVMEHESFEDDDVARVMNELFVCIKVDREERPDLDKIYQLAHQALTQRAGGWPLNVFLSPHDHVPFFAGTYFPKSPRFGMPGFVDLLQRIAAAYREQRETIEHQGAELRALFARLEASAPAAPITEAALTAARDELSSQFDARYGGFGGAPKFPHPTSLQFLLRHWARTARGGAPDTRALDIVRKTLEAMAHGGLYDQLGGGFCRYSVDDHWAIPHFEKMLYDNAQLLSLYADAALAIGEPATGASLHRGPRLGPIGEPATGASLHRGPRLGPIGDTLFARVARETAHWVMREMQSPEGGYYSTLDADSEGHEGKFYVWTPEEMRALLTEPEWQALRFRFGVSGAPNFEGQWHLNVRAGIADIAAKLGVPETAAAALVDGACAKLFAARERRVRPGRDEKVLTSWNGLMIGGMARAGRALREPAFVASAERALDFLRARLWHDGRLWATTKDGKSHLAAYLDDYAFALDAALELLQARWRSEDFAFARALADAMLAHFEDKAGGGFFFTADDHEQLLYRFKPVADDALPAGNGVAAFALARLGHLLGNADYLRAAARAVEAAQAAVSHYPSGHCALLIAAEEQLYPPETVVLRGDRTEAAIWLERAQARYAPQRLAVAAPDDVADLPQTFAQMDAGATITAYLCVGAACHAPLVRFDDYDRELRRGEAG